ncbi:MAG: hypothetical protein AAGK14_09075 [Verrucomicrobiota bacterium]
MYRPTAALVALLALTLCLESAFAQAEISPPSLGPDESAASGNAAPDASPSTGTIEIFRANMAAILVKTNSKAQVDGGMAAMVVVVDARGDSYTYVIGGSYGAGNLQAALLFAEQLRNCKKLVISRHRMEPKIGRLIVDFDLHVFDNR